MGTKEILTQLDNLTLRQGIDTITLLPLPERRKNLDPQEPVINNLEKRAQL